MLAREQERAAQTIAKLKADLDSKAPKLSIMRVCDQSENCEIISLREWNVLKTRLEEF